MQLIRVIRMPAFVLALLFLAVGYLSGCDKAMPGMQLAGMQGTAMWHVTISDPPAGQDAATVSAGLSDAFARSGRVLATWDQNSEISHFNAYQGSDWFAVSPQLAQAVDIALKLGKQSGGLYDITIRPLVELWGFGSADEAKDVIPDQVAIDAARAKVGYQKLQVRLDPPALRKERPDLHVELASLADGFAADQGGLYLESLGIHNYMVEIAGEIRTRGLSPREDDWRIAIEKPLDTGRAIQQGIRLENAGLATSGDYRSFFMHDGKRYSHTINPLTGYPVQHKLASVSVLAETGTLADAYATLLMAMGEEEGKRFAAQHGLSAYFIWRNSQGGFATYATPAFANTLTTDP